MRERTNFLEHIEPPDHIGIDLARIGFVLHPPVVLAVAEAFDVECHDLAPVRDVIDDAVLDQRGGAHALVGPVMDSASGQLRVGVLPEQLTVFFAEGHEDTHVALLPRISDGFVVCTDQHDALGDDLVAVGLRAEFRHPFNVPAGIDIPIGGQTGHV